MTKPLVQGQIGYWVNGQCVHMPKRKPSKSQHIEKGHVLRNRERREALNALAARRRYQKSILAADSLEFKHNSSLIEDLKNASKTGDIKSVWKPLKRIQLNVATRAKKDFFRIWTGCIFLPDIEERTALYYASLTGHSHIVEFFLSLYLVSVIQITQTNIEAAYTFREWFSFMKGTCKLKLPKSFNLKDYDVCVLNALNESVRYTLTKQKITIVDAMTILSKVMSRERHMGNFVLERIKIIQIDCDRMRKFLNNKKNKKSKKPLLNDDSFDCLYQDYDDDLWSDEDYHEDSTIDEEYDALVDDTIPNTMQVDVKDEQLRIEISESSDFSMASSNTIDKYTDFSIASSNIISERDIIYVEDGVNDIDSTSDFSLLNSTTSINFSQLSLDEVCVDVDSKEEENIQAWDIVSYSPSVTSISTSITKTASKLSTPYKDMLLKAGKPIVPNDRNNAFKVNEISKNSKSTIKGVGLIPQILEDNDQMNDAHFERDGFKNGRGGKSNKLFRGNDRTHTTGDCWYRGKTNTKRYNLQNSCRKILK